MGDIKNKNKEKAFGKMAKMERRNSRIVFDKNTTNLTFISRYFLR